MSETGLRNRFSLNEWTGSIGDLGTLLPLAFALVVYNGYAGSHLFFLWGMAYLATGLIFKVPLSVQPLKVMTVIAITQGLSPDLLSTTAFFYGLLFIIISTTGAIRVLQRWFSPVLISGIQLGIGLVLGLKAIQLIMENGTFLSLEPGVGFLNPVIFIVVVVAVLWLQHRQLQLWAVLVLVILSGLIILGVEHDAPVQSQRHLINPSLPNPTILLNVTILLIIPQLPLTLGNAVFAAAETAHDLWGRQAQQITPQRLGLSIGIANTAIGLLGGFPMCHGAGGLAAHAQFGARTGGSTIIIGVVLILAAMLPILSTLIFLVPVPILAAVLFVDGFRMVTLVGKLTIRTDYIIAILMGVTTLITGNMAIGLAVGLAMEQLFKYYKINKAKGISHD